MLDIKKRFYSEQTAKLTKQAKRRPEWGLQVRKLNACSPTRTRRITQSPGMVFLSIYLMNFHGVGGNGVRDHFGGKNAL